MKATGKVGRIFNIQRFSIHDGPGIRTIVFFKGCVMRCAWCCNPESQDFRIQSMIEGGKEKTVGYDVTVDDIMPEILSDMPYYARSGGGVTLSGGEPLLQRDFTLSLLSACKEEGFHTALDTAGSLTIPISQSVIDTADMLLLDIKSLNSNL